MPTAKIRWHKSEVSRLIRAARKVRVQVRVDIRHTPISPTQLQEKARKVGRRTIITAEDAKAWQERLPKVQPRERALDGVR
jgi:hypothetical protein